MLTCLKLSRPTKSTSTMTNLKRLIQSHIIKYGTGEYRLYEAVDAINDIVLNHREEATLMQAELDREFDL